MARLNLFFAFVLFVVYLTIAEAGVRDRRSPQFGQASASATVFGGNQRPGFGGPRPKFGGNIGRGPNGFGRGPQPGFGPNQPKQGTTINIAKSVSISTGSGGSSLAQASASSRG